MLLGMKKHIHLILNMHLIYCHIRSKQVAFLGVGFFVTFILFIPKNLGGHLCRRYQLESIYMPQQKS